MLTENRSPAWEKYREAQFFCRKLERADDGLSHVRAHTDTDEFRFYCSAFSHAVDDIHRQAAVTDDRLPFEEWTDDEVPLALHALFQDRCHDVFDVTTTRQESAADEHRIGTTTREPIPPKTMRYCLADDSGVSDELIPDDADRPPVSDLARAYLDHLDAWLTDTGPESDDEEPEASTAE